MIRRIGSISVFLPDSGFALLTPTMQVTLNYVEEHSKLAVTFLAGTACKAPSPKLYAILAWSAALQTIAPSSTSS
jgi:hypothetical protein